MKEVSVSIQGISPLLMNRPDVEGLAQQSNKRQSVGNPEEAFKHKLYTNDEGLLYQPYTHLEGTMVESAKQFKVKGNGKATYSKIFGYCVSVEPFEIVHKIQPNGKIEHFVTTAVRKQGGRIVTDRPMLRDWELDFSVQYDEEEVPLEVIKDVLDNAGKRCGIGDWRPAKKGKFGKFIVTQFKEVENA